MKSLGNLILKSDAAGFRDQAPAHNAQDGKEDYRHLVLFPTIASWSSEKSPQYLSLKVPMLDWSSLAPTLT